MLTHYGESLTIADAIRQPSIRRLVKTNGEAIMGPFVMGLLKEFLVYVPNALTPDEVANYADKILAHCPTWSTADLILCLKNGMDGRYGPIKFRWTWASDFVVWAAKYDQQKVDFFYQRHEKKKSEPKEDVISMIPSNIMEKFRKESLADPKKEEAMEIKVPREIVDQGLKAVDDYIDQIRKNKKP